VKYLHDYTFRWDPGLVLAKKKLEHNMVGKAEAERRLKKLASRFEVEEPPVRFSRRLKRPGYYDDEKHVIVLNPPVSEATVLHEFAHYLQDVQSPDDLEDAHGPVFCRYFRKVLEVWGVDVPHFEPYTPPRFTRQLAIREIVAVLPAEYTGFTFEGVQRPYPEVRWVLVEAMSAGADKHTGGDKLVYTFVLRTEGDSPYYKWVLCREYRREPGEPKRATLLRVFREDEEVNNDDDDQS